MARKNEGWFDLLVVLPWWVSVIVSISAYVGMNYIAPSIVTENIFLQAILKALPNLSPIIPLVLLIPAPISAFNAWRKRKLLDTQNSIQSIRNLSWREFEELVGEAFRRQGFTVIENNNAGADGGIDIRLRKDGLPHIVQCKNWKSSKVGVQIVREMYGVMVSENAASVFIITSGEFTQESINFAKNKPINLINGSRLETMIAEVQTTPAIKTVVETPKTSTNICPKCGGSLILRTAKKGSNAGNQFLGCSSFPKCRYTETRDSYI